MKSLFTLSLLLVAGAAYAMPVKTQMIKARAFYQEAEGGLLEALDLKAKTIRFTKAELEECGAKLMRKGKSLLYSCTLDLPVGANISRLRNVLSERTLLVSLGKNSTRKVFVQVSADAREVTFSTSFDATGLDFEVTKFNNDFYSVYAQSAKNVIGEAMLKNPLYLEVLESR
jgi:hypothetical protein